MSETVKDDVVADEAQSVPDSGTKIRLCGNRVLVLPIEGPATTRSGIFLPEASRKQTRRAFVVATGPGPRSPFTAQVAPMGFKVGDHVLYAEMSGQEVMIDGQDFLILREEDIILTYEEADPPADE